MPNELDEAVSAIEARANAATPLGNKLTLKRIYYEQGGGRMYNDNSSGRDLLVDVFNRNDRDFYFHAREDVPALIATIRSLQAEVERLQSFNFKDEREAVNNFRAAVVAHCRELEVKFNWKLAGEVAGGIGDFVEKLEVK